jgi:light-regulated signal transduction histidine kinase (bacteriophytochrome)
MAARKRVEAALGRQVEELRHSTAEVQERVAGIAHDLQQPLFLMASALELLSSSLQGQLDAEAQQFLNYARKGAQQLQTMLDALCQVRAQ